MGQSVYAIDGFPDDDLLWRIEWLGGVGYNTSVPSEPQIDVSLAQLPKGERNPLSARARSSQVQKRTVSLLRYRHKVRCPAGNDMGSVIRCCFVDGDTFESALARLSRDDGV